MIDPDFWRGRRVFLTGHTGFKGSWLCLWLHSLGAKVTGYALGPPTVPSLYEQGRVHECVTSVIADVRDSERLRVEIATARPEVVIHMAAQSLVRISYDAPVDTFATNVMGTVHLLEAVRETPGIRTVLNVTTDKVYENHESSRGYRENEPLGGYDPYSSSKACSELVTAAYRSSYFQTGSFDGQGVAVASARAGNVIGGGDWAADRLIPDVVRAVLARETPKIRNPHAVRPWQHVLEPLSGYLVLSQHLFEKGTAFAEAWNFGPSDESAKSVEWVTRRFCRLWGDSTAFTIDEGSHPHETTHLKLDYSKARAQLGWEPRWNLEKALRAVVSWTRALRDHSDLRAACMAQISEYGGTA
ncbi:MAG: CDP-glucose 4,6-dehydratase [Pseudomonadota bacterium]